MRGWLGNGRRGAGFYVLGIVLLLAVVGVSVFVGTDLLSATGEDRAKGVAPAVDRKAPKETVDQSAVVEGAFREEALSARKEAQERAAGKKATKEKATAEKKARDKAASEREAAERAAAEQAAAEQAAEQAAIDRDRLSAEQASASASAEAESAVAPADTTMYLTVPKMGIYDIPVVEGTTEASLTAGAGHLTGSGYPWVSGSNTFIAGHRVGYPGTPSDRVFYDLPNLVAGDEIVLTDSNGQTYTYAVSEIFAVSPSDTYVTSPIAGRDMVTLQTCTETPDDWTTIGPRLMSSGPESGRLIVRADRVA